MTLTNFAQWSESFLGLLADSALRTLVLAAVAGLGLALLRVKSTSLRLFTWTGVLYAALVLPLVSGLLPVLPVPVPSLLRSAVILHAEVAPAFPQVSRSNPNLGAEHLRARNSL